MNKETLKNAIKELAKEIHTTAKEHGWWDSNRNDCECLMLAVCELSEAVEYKRKGEHEPSDHIKDFTGEEEEIADCIIRLLDYSEHKKLDIAGALIAKMEFNKSRPYKHGKKF